MSSRREAREWAVQLLFQEDFNPDNRAESLATFWTEKKDADAKTRAFTEALVQGVLTNKPDLDVLIQKYADNWSLARMAGVDRNIIRVGVYEMLHCPDIPKAVTINEAVEIAKRMGDSGSGRFVNGILDRVRRELEKAAGTAS